MVCPKFAETDGLQTVADNPIRVAGRGKGWKMMGRELKNMEDRRPIHPSVIRPADHAVWRAEKMGKSTLFESPRLLVGLNAFEPGQQHALHAHAGMDKVYHVVQGEGVFLVEGAELPMAAGDMLVAPDGVPHGVRNTGLGRLLLILILAPSPAGAHG